MADIIYSVIYIEDIMLVDATAFGWYLVKGDLQGIVAVIQAQ